MGMPADLLQGELPEGEDLEVAALVGPVGTDSNTDSETILGSITIPIELPFDMSLSEKELGYVPRLMSVRLNGRQSKALKRLFNGMHRAGCRRHNGQHVDKLSHVLTWLLDHAADRLGIH